MQLAKLTLSRSCSASLPDRIQTTDNFTLFPKLRKKTGCERSARWPANALAHHVLVLSVDIQLMRIHWPDGQDIQIMRTSL
jgi:hypothetical protein